MSDARLPAGYVAVVRPGTAGFARKGADAWLARALDEAGTLHGWAGAHALESRVGRGRVHLVEAPTRGPNEAPSWAVRHYVRGGAVAPLLGDRYWGLGSSRPARELAASEHLRGAGVRTPAVVGGAVYRQGTGAALGFYRADLVTEHVPHARTLASTVLGGGGDTRAALERSGLLLRSVAEAGVLHVDLNASNVLLAESGDAWVLDLDRARLGQADTARTVTAMLVRLERSLRKLETTHARRLDADEWRSLREGAGRP